MYMFISDQLLFYQIVAASESTSYGLLDRGRSLFSSHSCWSGLSGGLYICLLEISSCNGPKRRIRF